MAVDFISSDASVTRESTELIVNLSRPTGSFALHPDCPKNVFVPPISNSVIYQPLMSGIVVRLQFLKFNSRYSRSPCALSFISSGSMDRLLFKDMSSNFVKLDKSKLVIPQ